MKSLLNGNIELSFFLDICQKCENRPCNKNAKSQKASSFWFGRLSGRCNDNTNSYFADLEWLSQKKRMEITESEIPWNVLLQPGSPVLQNVSSFFPFFPCICFSSNVLPGRWGECIVWWRYNTTGPSYKISKMWISEKLSG